VASATVAHYVPTAWFIDPAGAIVISMIIFFKWVHVGMEHANKVVGRRCVCVSCCIW
jgi:divalent metal cation (Fe/Co/Zn/Cd) transporter